MAFRPHPCFGLHGNVAAARFQFAQSGKQGGFDRRLSIEIQDPHRAGSGPAIDQGIEQGGRRHWHEGKTLSEQARDVHALQIVEQGFIVQALHIRQRGITRVVRCAAQLEGVTGNPLLAAQHGLAAHHRGGLVRGRLRGRHDRLVHLGECGAIDLRGGMVPIARQHSNKTIQHAAFLLNDTRGHR